MDFSWLTCFICVLAILPDSLGHKYFTLNNALPGTIYIGTRSEVISKTVTANKVQNSFSPLLRPLVQDQFSFDMELCDLVTITKGSFVVADREETQSGVMFQCLSRPDDSFEIKEILTIMATNMKSYYKKFVKFGETQLLEPFSLAKGFRYMYTTLLINRGFTGSVVYRKPLASEDAQEYNLIYEQLFKNKVSMSS